MPKIFLIFNLVNFLKICVDLVHTVLNRLDSPKDKSIVFVLNAYLVLIVEEFLKELPDSVLIQLLHFISWFAYNI